MDFHTEQKIILRCLEESLFSDQTVGVYAPDALGAGIFITTVEEISLDESGVSVHLGSVEVSGASLAKRKLGLHEIRKVLPFSMPKQKRSLTYLSGVQVYQINN